MEAASSASDQAPLPDDGGNENAGHDEVRVNVHYAKTHLSKLLEKVEAGEQVTVCRNGTPVASLVPWRPKSTIGPPGTMKGMFQDWELDFVGQTTDEEVLRAIYGDDFDMGRERAFFEEGPDGKHP